MGKDRISGKWKSVSAFADTPVNYIHIDDILDIVSGLISQNVYQGIFNLVAPQHPLRSQVHHKNAKDFGFEIGSFTKSTNQRTISSAKIINTLKYSFIHPDPLKFWT